MLSFDPSIRAGDIIQIVAFLGVGIGAYYGIKAKIQETNAELKLLKLTHEIRLDFIDAALEDAKQTMSGTQAQDMHIAQMRKELDELRHWRGFVNPSGEYRRDATPMIPV